MEMIERKALTQDEMIMELLQLLKQNNMQQESKDTYELCAYIDSLEKKLDSMTTELVNMQNRIDELQESQISKAIQARMAEAKERHVRKSSAYLQQQVLSLQQQLVMVQQQAKRRMSLM